LKNQDFFAGEQLKSIRPIFFAGFAHEIDGLKHTRYRPTIQTEAYPTVCGVVWSQVLGILGNVVLGTPRVS